MKNASFFIFFLTIFLEDLQFGLPSPAISKADMKHTISFHTHEFDEANRSIKANISFHRCDRYLREGTTELTLRKAIASLEDTNNDGARVICLESNQEITLKNGPIYITKDMAIIGAQNKAPSIKNVGKYPIFKNEDSVLFMYNLKLVTEADDSSALYLGIGSYLGADNLNIKVNSKNADGILCFGCAIDGDRISIVSNFKNSNVLTSSLGFLELEWAELNVSGENPNKAGVILSISQSGPF